VSLASVRAQRRTTPVLVRGRRHQRVQVQRADPALLHQKPDRLVVVAEDGQHQTVHGRLAKATAVGQLLDILHFSIVVIFNYFSFFTTKKKVEFFNANNQISP